MNDKWHQLATDRLAEIGRLKEALAAEEIAHAQTTANFQAMGLGFIEERRSYESRLGALEVENIKLGKQLATMAGEAIEQGEIETNWSNEVRRFETIEAENKALLGRLDSCQAKLDAVMLEYCPGEMTSEQVENWEAAQRSVIEAEGGWTQQSEIKASVVSPQTDTSGVVSDETADPHTQRGITLHAFEADINELSECQHCGWPKEDRRHFVVERGLTK